MSGIPLDKLLWALREAARKDKYHPEQVMVRNGELINIRDGVPHRLAEMPGQQSHWVAQDSTCAVIASRPCYNA